MKQYNTSSKETLQINSNKFHIKQIYNTIHNKPLYKVQQKIRFISILLLKSSYQQIKNIKYDDMSKNETIIKLINDITLHDKNSYIFIWLYQIYSNACSKIKTVDKVKSDAFIMAKKYKVKTDTTNDINPHIG